MKVFFTVLLGLATLSAHAQITLESNHNEYLEPFKLSTGEVKYAGLNYVTNQVRIYNPNHSLYKQVATGIPANSQLGDILNASDHLFNSTAGIEVAFTYSTQLANGEYSYHYRVLDENAANVLQIDSCSYAEAYNLPTGTKLVAYIGRAQQVGTKIYSLPGALTPLKTPGRSEEMQLSPFPNPATESIQLPYSVGRGQTAQLEIIDMSGRQVRSFTVDSTFDHLLLQARELNAGVYTYRVSSAAGITAGKRFVVKN